MNDHPENNKTDLFFSVPLSVVKEHLADCDGIKLKTILLILSDPSAHIDPKFLADSLSMTLADIRDALNFWVRKGLISCAEDGSFSVVAQSSASISAPFSPVEKVSKPAPARLTPNEVHTITQRQPIVRSLLHETEAILGKTLTSTDISTIISLYDWAGIPGDVILMVVAHCASLDKRNLRYIEKTALSWLEMGLDTVEKVESYLNEQTVIRRREKEVQSAFGIYDRKLTGKEREAIAKWYGEYEFAIDLIRLAYEKTVENTGKVSFPYIGKILSSWYEKGIRTPAQALAESSAPPKNTENAKKEYSFDLESFEQLNRWKIPDAE